MNNWIPTCPTYLTMTVTFNARPDRILAVFAPMSWSRKKLICREQHFAACWIAMKVVFYTASYYGAAGRRRVALHLCREILLIITSHAKIGFPAASDPSNKSQFVNWTITYRYMTSNVPKLAIDITFTVQFAWELSTLFNFQMLNNTLKPSHSMTRMKL